MIPTKISQENNLFKYVCYDIYSDILRDYFAEHAHLFKDCVNDSPESMEEQDLDKYVTFLKLNFLEDHVFNLFLQAVFQGYLKLYEETLSDYLSSLDVSIEEFFFQLEDVKNDPNLKENKKLKNFVKYLLASTDYPAFYKVMVRAAKKQYRNGELIAEGKEESKAYDGGAKAVGGKSVDDDYSYDAKREYK